MPYDLLFRRIEERRKELGIPSERKLLLKANLGLKTIYHFHKVGHAPKPAAIAAIARVLEVPEAYLLEAAAEGAPQAELQPRHTLRQVYVKGAVQAGVFREALVWSPSEWFTVTVPDDELYPGVERFGLLVRGPSMDRIYPDGSVVLVVRFEDIGLIPETGDDVVVLRRPRGAVDLEATLKEYELDDQGRHVLWPRSSDPEFQAPFVLATPDLPVSDGSEELPPVIQANAIGSDDEIIVHSLVIGSYMRARRRNQRGRSR